MLPIRLLGVLGFFYWLRGMMKLRGWRVRDGLVLLATIFIYLIVSPVRFALFIFQPLFPRASRGVWARWRRWLFSVDSNVVFNCVVATTDGLLRLRRATYDPWVVLGDFEKSAKEIFSCNEGEVVVDVGAHIGLYTIRASRMVGTHGKVIAVEADSSNFEALLFNLKLNEANNVIPLNLAAWNQETMLDLHIAKENIMSHSSVYLTKLLEGSSKSVKVSARPLDTVLGELGIETVDWIKIDVEGAEVEVLKGLEKTISHNPNLKLIVEVHSDEIREKCLSILQEKGYAIREISDHHLFASPVVH